MQFVNAVSMVRKAQAGGYAVPALNTNGGTYDITRAALEACQQMRAPALLQVYEPNTEYRGIPHFVRQVQSLCSDLDITVPVCLQLDHGHSLEFVTNAVQAGLTSVMFDGSHEPFEINVARTREVVAMAREHGASVEGEIGYVAGNEPEPVEQIGRVPVPDTPSIPAARTDVNEAAAFAEQTGVDLLAVSIGTIHGVYRHQTEIDFDLLADLAGAVEVPLVQHGTCGISLEDLSRLAARGMAKVNFGEPFRYNHIRYYCELTDSMAHKWHAWRIMREVKDRLKADMIELIEALGADGKAG